MGSFDVPDRNDIADLTVGGITRADSLSATDIVICINRGRKTLVDKFDGVDHKIPPGLFRTEYGRAQHFQRKQIVPGTRNVEVGGYVSFIGILGSEDGRIACDAPEARQPFTDAELTDYGERVEGIDRGALTGEADRDVAVVPVSGNSRPRRGASMRPVIDTRQQATPGAEAAAAHVFEPSDEPNAAKQAEAEYGDGSDGSDGDEGQPQPRPFRGSKKK